MSRSLTIRQPSAAELRQLHEFLEEELTPWQRRRAEVLLLHAAGLSGTDIASLLEAHPHTVYTDLHAFARDGLASVRQPRCLGTPKRLTDEQRATICQLAEVPPYELGLPYGRWSLAKFRAYLLKRRLVKAISREHLRRVLEKGGSTSVACSGSCSARTRGGGPFWLGSVSSGSACRALASWCSSMSSPSRSRLTGAGAIPRPGAWYWPGPRRPVASSTCSSCTR